MFTVSVVVVDLPTDCILSFLFPAETDVLVPFFSQSTDVVVVLKFPILPCKNRPLLPEGNRIELIVSAAQNLLVLKSRQFSVSESLLLLLLLLTLSKQFVVYVEYM